MFRPPTARFGSTNSGLPKQALVLLLIVTALKPAHSQENGSGLVRLFRLDGSFSTELVAKIRSENKSENPRFTLRHAKLEADQMGALTRLRSVLALANGDTGRRITEVEWRLDIYDASLLNLNSRVLQSDKVNIYPGETAAASAKFGAVLPDRMVVLLQLVRVSFADGPAWSPATECSLGEDLRSVSCKSK